MKKQTNNKHLFLLLIVGVMLSSGNLSANFLGYGKLPTKMAEEVFILGEDAKSARNGWSYLNSDMHFSADLASDTSKIFLMHSILYEKCNTGGIRIDSTKISIFEINKKDLNADLGILSLTYPNPLPPIQLTKNENLLTLHCWKANSALTSFVMPMTLRTMQASISQSSASWKVDLENEDLYKGIIDTSVRSWQTSYINNKNFYVCENNGLIEATFEGSVGNYYYYFRKISTKKEFVWDKDILNNGNLRDVIYDLGTDTVGLTILTGSSVSNFTKLSKNNNRFTFPLRKNNRFHGLLTINFDNDGNMISSKIVGNNDNFEFSSTWGDVTYENGHIYLFGRKNGKFLFQQITFDDEIINEVFYDVHYTNSEILKQYEGQNIIRKIKITDRNELYVYGGVWDGDTTGPNEKVMYLFYLAKYDSTMKLVYEKRWLPEGFNNAVLRNIIVHNDTVFIQGSMEYIKDITCYTEEWGDISTIGYTKNSIYVAKLKEQPVSINEPSTVANLQVSPNPTSNSVTLTVDLVTAGNLTVTLNNLLGQELLEIHSGFTDAGTFTKTFSIETLPKGVYYLKIIHNGNVTVEKVVRK